MLLHMCISVSIIRFAQASAWECATTRQPPRSRASQPHASEDIGMDRTDALTRHWPIVSCCNVLSVSNGCSAAFAQMVATAEAAPFFKPLARLPSAEL
eukprot:6208188-Pleurochrysis_carterae.AAC.6